jgi:hypothetical protein
MAENASTNCYLFYVTAVTNLIMPQRHLLYYVPPLLHQIYYVVDPTRKRQHQHAGGENEEQQGQT